MQLRKHREINVFNLSMLDVIACALGAILIVLMIVMEQKGKSETAVTEADAKINALNDTLASATDEIRNLEDRLANDGGLNLGDNVVFILDISGSMKMDEDLEHTPNYKIHEVRAALKLLMASLKNTQKIDIVVFPAPNAEGDYQALWKTLKTLDESSRPAAYAFLDSLEAKGGTPTRAVLHHVLSSKNYARPLDIVLFSDGSPTLSVSSNEFDDVDDLLNSLNQYTIKVHINTIGVDLEDKPTATDFMVRLAKLFKSFNYAI